ncbi:MAG: hypothetical protein O8C63_03725 [Candidatus Methanoperedens sp.]|nr:hypothetical protein [Candidatus Methanoperedens sp.]
MNWYRRGPAIGMPELLVGAPLANLCEAERFKNGNHFTGPENRGLAHTQLMLTV